MGCCDENSVQVSKMALELKSGPMLWYKRRLCGSNWRNVHGVLYNDSSLLWYRSKSRQEQEGGVVLKNAPELIAFGTYTSQVPNRPTLPDDYEPKELLAFGVRGKDVVYWLLCPNEDEVQSWIAAIASTMPSPSAPPEGVPPPTAGQSPPPQQMPSQQMPSQQMPPQYTPNQQMPSYNTPQGIPGQYPPPVQYRPPAYQNAVYPQPPPYQYPAGGGGPTTVIVQQDRPGCVTSGGGDFAMGMLMGGVLGGALGTAWGASTHHGFGFGAGFGHGGGWHAGSSIQENTNVTVNNYYDNDTTTINNNLDMTSSVAIEQAPQPAIMASEDFVAVEDYSGGGDGMYGGDDYGGMDYGAADFGGGDFGGGDFGDF